MLPAKLSLEIETRRVTSFDGTEISYRITRPPSYGAKVVVLANGLGGPFLAWRPQIDSLADRYQCITWDYRGLYQSKRPYPDHARSYSVAHHVRDLEAILSKERVTAASLVGWSMGVQVVLEAFRRLPGTATNLILLNGTYRRPLDSLSLAPGMERLVSTLLEAAQRAHSFTTQMTRKATSQPEAVAWLKRMGLLGTALEDSVFAQLVHAFGQLDMDAYLKNLKALGEHDAEDVLRQINVPTLVITGDKDTMTPPALAQTMARRISAAEILVVRGGTHYTAVEYPELISLRIERFYDKHGF